MIVKVVWQTVKAVDPAAIRRLNFSALELNGGARKGVNGYLLGNTL